MQDAMHWCVLTHVKFQFKIWVSYVIRRVGLRQGEVMNKISNFQYRCN